MKQRKVVLSGVLIVLLLAVSLTVRGEGYNRIEYYGADAAGPDDWEWLSSQGVNAVFLGMSGGGMGDAFYERAREAGVKLFVWPLGSHEEGTPWKWEGGNDWDITQGTVLLRELVRNRDVVIAVMSLHEPYWRGGAGAIPAESQKALADEIRGYTRAYGHELEVLNLVNSVSYWQDDPVVQGQMDWAGIWLHCWDAEGTEQQARELVSQDRAYIDAHGLDIKLVFLVQAFGIDGTSYRMPTYDELRGLSCDILGQNALEGFLYYSWGQAGGHYTDWLENHPELHGVIKDVYDNCVDIEQPEPTDTPTPQPPPTIVPTDTPIPVPTSTSTPDDIPPTKIPETKTPTPTHTPEPTDTPIPEPTDTPTPAPTPEPPSCDLDYQWSWCVRCGESWDWRFSAKWYGWHRCVWSFLVCVWDNAHTEDGDGDGTWTCPCEGCGP